MPYIANSNTGFQPLLANIHEPFHEKMMTLHFIWKNLVFMKTLHFIHFLLSLDNCDCVVW